MAVFQFSPNVAFPELPGLDRSSIRQSLVNLLLESWGEVRSATSFKLLFDGATLDFVGTGLTFAPGNTDVTAFSSGTITGLTLWAAPVRSVTEVGTVLLSVTGLSVPAANFSAFFEAENSAAAFDLLLTENDIVNGAAGLDILVGGIGNDTITGGAGNDQLIGEVGADRLIGGGGADQLTGGAGRDVMTGGSGRDSFVFRSATDTSATPAAADVITDFRQGQDRIDLRAIDAFRGTAVNDAFLWIGTAAFANGVAGDVRYRKLDEAGTENDHTLVLVDTDGDRGAEAVIRLTGLHDLTAADFLL